METWKLLDLLRLSALLCALFAPPEREFRGEVVSVHDGDTLTVRTSTGKQESVRLLHVDAPELKQPWGTEAGDYARQWANGRVTVRYRSRDRYGRILGDVLIEDGSSLNLGLLKWGYAWRWKDDRDADSAALEAEAQRAKRGLWATEKPEAPWDYRERIREARR